MRQVLAMKADNRAKWLAKALQQAQDGRLSPKSLYDIIAHQKFGNDLSEKAQQLSVAQCTATLASVAGTLPCYPKNLLSFCH